MITVLVADDTQISRNEGIKVLLSTAEDIQVVAEAETPLEAVAKVREFEPDIVLMDLKWFGNVEAGQTAIRQIKALKPKTKVIAMSAYDELLKDAQRAGAAIGIAKTSIGDDNLTKMIRDLYVQEYSTDAIAAPELMRLANLSTREFEVLSLLRKGYANKEIKSALNIELSTVKNHVRSVLTKLGAKNRTEAAEIARTLGI